MYVAFSDKNSLALKSNFVLINFLSPVLSNSSKTSVPLINLSFKSVFNLIIIPLNFSTAALNFYNLSVYFATASVNFSFSFYRSILSASKGLLGTTSLPFFGGGAFVAFLSS